MTSVLPSVAASGKENKHKNKQTELYIEIKSFCTSKETTTKTKRNPTEWVKIFSYHTFDKWLITQVYKTLRKLITTKQISPIKTKDNGTGFSLKKTYRWPRQAHEKTFIIYQGSTNQSGNVILSHVSENDLFNKGQKQQMLAGIWRRRNFSHCWDYKLVQIW